MPLFDEESRLVAQITQQLQAEGEGFPSWWREADTLRFLHEFDFNPQVTTERIREHFRWLKSVPGSRLSEQAKFMLETGVIYQLGRDHNFSPNVYFIVSKLKNVQENMNFILEALMHLLILVREKMLLPYHVERWNLFVDCTGTTELSTGNNIMGQIYESIRANFPMTLGKIILVNAGLAESIAAQFNQNQSRSLRNRVIIIADRNDPQINQHIGPD